MALSFPCVASASLNAVDFIKNNWLASAHVPSIAQLCKKRIVR